MIESCDDVSVESDWEFVEPPCSFFSKKRSLDWADLQEKVRYEGSPVKSASALQKKNDAAHATTYLVHAKCGDAVANGHGGARKWLESS